jgi:hypothetical protein
VFLLGIFKRPLYYKTKTYKTKTWQLKTRLTKQRPHHYKHKTYKSKTYTSTLDRYLFRHLGERSGVWYLDQEHRAPWWLWLDSTSRPTNELGTLTDPPTIIGFGWFSPSQHDYMNRSSAKHFQFVELCFVYKKVQPFLSHGWRFQSLWLEVFF